MIVVRLDDANPWRNILGGNMKMVGTGGRPAVVFCNAPRMQPASREEVAQPSRDKASEVLEDGLGSDRYMRADWQVRPLEHVLTKEVLIDRLVIYIWEQTFHRKLGTAWTDVVSACDICTVHG